MLSRRSAMAALAGSAVAIVPLQLHARDWVDGDGANLNGVSLDQLQLGVGDRLVWSFGRSPNYVATVSTIDLIQGDPSLDRAPEPLRLQLEGLRREQGLHNARSVCLWVTPAWKPGWFPASEIQRALDGGITPVFLD